MSTHSHHTKKDFIISPYLTVQDVGAAVAFYQKAFQFNLSEINSKESETNVHAEMTYKNQLIMCGKEGAYGSSLKSPLTSGIESPITLCVSCENVDAFYQKALEEGAQSLSAPEDMFWGFRMCRLQDLDHYTWCFMTHLS